MEKEIKLLKDKVQDLSQENVALREINIQFQLENFKLQQKIKKLENSQFDDCISEIEDDAKESSLDMALTESTFDPSAEYLEEDVSTPSPQRNKLKPQESTLMRSECDVNISYEESFIPEDYSQSENNETMIFKQETVYFEPFPYEVVQTDGSSSPISNTKKDFDKNDTEAIKEVDPKSAAETIFKLAAKRGIIHRIKSIDKGKQKDSSFVNKILDLCFDRETLASSSARGKKCQAMLHKPARPALDAKKLQMCRQAFLYRLKQEGLSYSQREERFRHFNGYVNFKIQNARKLLKK